MKIFAAPLILVIFSFLLHRESGVEASTESMDHIEYKIPEKQPYRTSYHFQPQQNWMNGTSLDLRFDYGKFYASKSFFDYPKNRRILWGWVNESDSSTDDIEKGWVGLQSIPRQVWLDQSGKQLVQWPIEEVEKLRDKQIRITGKELVSGTTLEVSGITASQADVEVLFELPELESAEWLDASEVDPQLLCSQEYASRSGIIDHLVC
uniref:Glycosyl hydrolase family 32 N-terminal domain-containing protein n=1 Tax=Lotus japonicus TaxID=34305 RepID=I3S5X8_LOTJA|nr:unknown [Lotus japonicus]